MIPADVASRLQAAAESSLRPVAPAQELSDKLSNLSAGQRVLAEIQALLPNGTYRALINQRSITLALPFSAKSGDSLELLVTQTNGKLALALASKPDVQANGAKDSTPAIFSRTGQLISNLLANAKEARSPGVLLNNNLPIANLPPSKAQDILPLLRQAITQSGMFYESHQAAWAQGRLAQAALLQEPQGKLSTPLAPNAENNQAAKDAPNTNATNTNNPALNTSNPALKEDAAAPQRGTLLNATSERADALKPNTPPNSQPNTASNTPQSTAPTSQQNVGQIVAPQTQAIVQQQLSALANQNFVWHGQVWPGQDMQWEIAEEERAPDQGEDENSRWVTRLQLRFPSLGGIDAKIQLHNNQIVLKLSSDTPEANALLRAESESLRQQMDAAGLVIAALSFEHLLVEKPLVSNDASNSAASRAPRDAD